MSLALNIFLGIIAGVITYVITSAAIAFFKKVVVPWYQANIYRGNYIGGEWYGYNAKIGDNGEYVQDEESESTIVIKQQGNKISGELLLTMQPNGNKCRKVFKLAGSFVDTILVLDHRVGDSSAMGMGATVMKLSEGGNKLKGKHVFISSYDWSSVVARTQVWTRNIGQNT